MNKIYDTFQKFKFLWNECSKNYGNYDSRISLINFIADNINDFEIIIERQLGDYEYGTINVFGYEESKINVGGMFLSLLRQRVAFNAKQNVEMASLDTSEEQSDSQYITFDDILNGISTNQSEI